MGKLNLDEMAVLKDVKNRSELRPYFFKKISKAKWFDALCELGFFDVGEIPRPVAVKDQYFSIPHWPVLAYLVAVSEQLQDKDDPILEKKIWGVLTKITAYAKKNDFGNNRVWWQFSKIIRLMPLDLIKQDYMEVIQYWLSDKFGAESVGDQLLGWLDQLFESTDPLSKEFSLSLLELVYVIRDVEKLHLPGGRTDTKLTLMSWLGERKKDNSVALKAGRVLGTDALDFFVSKMEEVLKLEDNDSWSSTWRTAIEDHPQDLQGENANELLVEALRDSLNGYLTASEAKEVNAIVRRLLGNDFQTIKRIAIYGASEHFDHLDEQVIGKILNSEYFNDNYRHELWHFLHRRFGKLSEDQQTSVLKIIQGLKGQADEGENADQDLLQKRTAYLQSLWLSAIKDQSKAANILFRVCISITENEPDHPDFSFYMTTGSVTHESPVSIEDLSVMLETPKILVTFLNSYSKRGHFNEPGIEGLTKTFGGLVLNSSQSIIDSLDEFLALKPRFLHELYNAIFNLWDKSETLAWNDAWSKILLFSEKLFEDELFWKYTEDSEGGAFVGNTDRVVGDVARLIEAGCKKDEHAFSLHLAPLARSVLEKILVRQQGEEFKLNRDAVSIAINSPRGGCIEAYINLALYHCRNTNDEERPAVAALYLELFKAELAKDEESSNQFEFVTLFANFFPNFLYLARDWSLANIPKIFDREYRLRWLCAVQGFSYQNQVISEVYDHLKQCGDFPKILNSEELENRVGKHYISLIVINYFRGKESVEDPESLISLLLLRNKYSETGHLIWFIWTLRNEDNLGRVKEMIRELFPEILNNLDFQTEEGKKTASRLCYWAIFFDELGAESKSWLLQISPYAAVDYNSAYLLEALAKLSVEYPSESFEIWDKTFENFVNDYSPEKIKKIFKNFIASGTKGHRYAKDIADKYFKNELEHPRELLEEAKKEAEDK